MVKVACCFCIYLIKSEFYKVSEHVINISLRGKVNEERNNISSENDNQKNWNIVEVRSGLDESILGRKKKIIVNTIMVLSIIMCMYLNVHVCIIPHIVHSYSILDLLVLSTLL